MFHDNIEPNALEQYLLDTISDAYLQVNEWDAEKEHILLLSKKGKVTYKTKKLPRAEQNKTMQTPEGNAQTADFSYEDHNRQKNYILKEGQVIPPLVDMGVFHQRGKSSQIHVR